MEFGTCRRRKPRAERGSAVRSTGASKVKDYGAWKTSWWTNRSDTPSRFEARRGPASAQFGVSRPEPAVASLIGEPWKGSPALPRWYAAGEAGGLPTRSVFVGL